VAGYVIHTEMVTCLSPLSRLRNGYDVVKLPWSKLPANVTSMNVLQIRNWWALLHVRLADALFSLARWQHGILLRERMLWHHLEIVT